MSEQIHKFSGWHQTVLNKRFLLEVSTVRYIDGDDVLELS